MASNYMIQMHSTEQTQSQGTVIIGFAESFSSPEVTWSLVNAGYKVVAFARQNSRAALCSSRHATFFEVTAPEKDASATIRELDAAIERLLASSSTNISLLILDDAALWILPRLRKQARLILIAPPEVTVALKKDLQIETARAAGFKVPETFILKDRPSSITPPLEFPFILKPVDAISAMEGRLTKGRFFICHNTADYETAIQQIPHDGSMMAQQYITGGGEGLFGLATEQGVIAWSAHRRLRMMNPLGSGASACISIAPDAYNITAGIKFIQSVAWRGPFMIELLRDAGGNCWFMEFNGRVWGSTALARRCGLEYPAWAVSHVLNPLAPLPHQQSSPPGIVCRHAGRELIHGLFVLRGPRSQSSDQWPSRWKTLVALLRFRPSEYWYNWRTDDWRVFVKDIMATISGNVFKKRGPKRP